MSRKMGIAVQLAAGSFRTKITKGNLRFIVLLD